MDDAIPKGTLEYGVVGKALANSVGWVDRCGALTLRDHIWSRQRRLTNLDLLSFKKKKRKKEIFFLKRGRVTGYFLSASNITSSYICTLSHIY